MKPLTQHDIEEFNNKIYDIYKNETTIIVDGIIDVDSYNSSNKKILWILKEPYGEDAFNYSKYIKGFQFGKSFPTSGAMWAKITYVNYGILNNYQMWNEFKTLYEDEDVFKALKNCALINLKKIPGKTRSDNNEIMNSYKLYKDLVHEQISFINPIIVICGGTFRLLDYPFEKANSINGKNLIGYKYDNKIFIDAYHPSYFIKKQEEYCDEIITMCRNFIQNI